MKSFLAAGGACLALVSVLLACGSSSDSEFRDPNASANNGIAGSSGDGGGSPIFGTSGGAGSSSGEPTNIEDGGACAAKSADAARKPAYLFFILDQSASMSAPSCVFENPQCFGQQEPDDPPRPKCCTESELPKRWKPITQALDAFVNDPVSKGITAGLELFPSQTSNFCSVSTYASDASKMDVPMTALPDPTKTTFKSKFVADPNGQGTQFLGTPTLMVFQAMGPIVQKWADEHKDGKTAIVLLTDGYPQQCSDEGNSIASAAAEIKKTTDKGVPTYVIGVSDDPDNLKDLQTLSDAGKTTLTRVDTSDPVKTQKAFLDRINEIRKSTLSCDVSLPAPPAGLTLDLGKVNVTFTSGKGDKQLLTYDETCKGTGKSWHFDSTTSPTKIELCTATCDVFEADPDGAVSVEFGCERRDDTGVK